MIVALALINPFKQLNKLYDSQRINDVKQIQTALDSYYDDKNCYPQSLAELVPKYIPKIPNDPGNNGYNYVFMSSIDGTGKIVQTCADRQWYVLYARTTYKPTTSTACPLEQIPDENGHDCLPINYNNGAGYNYCREGGNIDCDSIHSQTLIEPEPTITPTGVPTDTPIPPTPTFGLPTPTPTTPPPPPTITPFACSGGIFAYPVGSSNCNSISPITQCDFAGGNLICYQNRGGTNNQTCIEPVCTSYK